MHLVEVAYHHFVSRQDAGFYGPKRLCDCEIADAWPHYVGKIGLREYLGMSWDEVEQEQNLGIRFYGVLTRMYMRLSYWKSLVFSLGIARRTQIAEVIDAD